MSGIVVVVNSRAERGPLESVIAALPEARVESFDASGMEAAHATSMAIRYFTERLAGARLVILLGDRYETLAAALAATFLRIPVAHIHGGETTTGAFDDAFRWSITHLTEGMNGLHFAATKNAAYNISSACFAGKRALERVYIVGAPGLDGVPENSARRDRKLMLVTYHPETRAPDRGLANCKAMLSALERFLGYELIFTGVNTDPGSADIGDAINTWLKTHGGIVRADIQHAEYISLMQHAALVIGNSSAGIIEAPYIGVPTVNIGDRQLGREMANTVFQNDYDIGAAIKQALAFNGTPKPIYRGGAAEKIAAVCREFVK